MEKLMRRIDVASKRKAADTVIKNGKIIDVFNLEIIEADIAIADGVIVGIGEGYEGQKVIDAKDRYVAPSFIDGHVHIESSMVAPSEFSKVVLPHGITTVITDPHEIANVCGEKGISFFLENSEELPLDVFFMLPSSVPATPFENAGAKLLAKDLKPFFSHERVLGLAEVMDYPAVMNNDAAMIEKLSMTNKIDGHAAGLDVDGINIYRAARIKTDHECITPKEAKERIQRGMYVMIREGSGAKNLIDLIPVVNEKNSRRFLFCTDDKHLDELISEGSIDHNVRLAIQQGLDPILAIQLASLNAAECFGLENKGAIAPGYEADFIIVDDLNKLTGMTVYKAGERVADNGIYLLKDNDSVKPKPEITNTVKIDNIKKEHLNIKIPSENKANIIGIIPNQIVTERLIEPVHIENGLFIPSVERDQLKLAVIERHSNTHNIGLGIVKGFKLTSGAIAGTVAHDSHNLVAAGTTDEDIITAIEAIKEMNGGLVVVKDSKVLAKVPLAVAGLVSLENYETVNRQLKQLHKALNEITPIKDFSLFSILSFLCLPVIPQLKLTDLGLFDVDRFEHISISL
ncbi:adenine deaminase [Metabacillus fastidiosus]|uniref:Adenine deaminase n=1 Tax=Metabacillus fastidiosus TaxID=1458 RepID=A0ABU6P315_9BACI|nr:adenine deaminase [Metabacillus fastidiosus]MED4403465.1 adenine deaminase [Metabacillus fastidiosus]